MPRWSGKVLLSPSVAFMQGRLKTSGDNGLLLSVLAWSATGAFARRWLRGQPRRCYLRPSPKQS